MVPLGKPASWSLRASAIVSVESRTLPPGNRVVAVRHVRGERRNFAMTRLTTRFGITTRAVVTRPGHADEAFDSISRVIADLLRALPVEACRRCSRSWHDAAVNQRDVTEDSNQAQEKLSFQPGDERIDFDGGGSAAPASGSFCDSTVWRSAAASPRHEKHR